MGAHLVEFFPWLRHLPSGWVLSVHRKELTWKIILKKHGKMEARCRGFLQGKFCDARKPFSYGRGKHCMYCLTF
jgi:hypothetical protein